MSAFLSKLEVENVDDINAQGRGFWKITAPFIYQSDILGKTITVETGFITDYASVPRIPIAYWLCGDTSHLPAVLHDWLFHHHEVCSEQMANQVLLEAMEVNGEPQWRAEMIYLGVAVGGQTSWEDDGNGDGHSIINGKIV